MAERPRGRPKGSIDTSKHKFLKGVTKHTPELKLTSPPREVVEERVYYCTSCGKPFNKLKGNFRASQSPFYKGWGYIPICVKCLDYFEEQYTKLLGSNDEAIKRLALHLDLYLNESLLSSSTKVNAGQSRISQYISTTNLQQHKDKTYDTYLVENTSIMFSARNSVAGLEQYDSDSNEYSPQKVEWTDGDIKNKNYVIHNVGYDCFDDWSYSEENKKFLYNTLADYLTDEVLEDQHMLQSIIAMVKSILQRENIDRMLNAQIRQSAPNYTLVAQLGKIKTDLTSDINSIAKENAVSAKNSGKSSKGSNTLTNITKEMLDNNFDDVKVNIVDVKMSNAYQTIAEKNAKALINELNYQSDDYARLLSESRTFVENLQDEIMKLEEENRKLKIEMKKSGRSDN